MHERLKELYKYKGYFRVLEHWDFVWISGSEYKGQITPNVRTKTAYVYEYGEDEPDDFIFHEMLHVCLREIRSGTSKEQYEKEEMLVQDLCKLMGV